MAFWGLLVDDDGSYEGPSLISPNDANPFKAEDAWDS